MFLSLATPSGSWQQCMQLPPSDTENEWDERNTMQCHLKIPFIQALKCIWIQIYMPSFNLHSRNIKALYKNSLTKMLNSWLLCYSKLTLSCCYSPTCRWNQIFSIYLLFKVTRNALLHHLWLHLSLFLESIFHQNRSSHTCWHFSSGLFDCLCF